MLFVFFFCWRATLKLCMSIFLVSELFTKAQTNPLESPVCRVRWSPGHEIDIDCSAFQPVHFWGKLWEGKTLVLGPISSNLCFIYSFRGFTALISKSYIQHFSAAGVPQVLLCHKVSTGTISDPKRHPKEMHETTKKYKF